MVDHEATPLLLARSSHGLAEKNKQSLLNRCVWAIGMACVGILLVLVNAYHQQGILVDADPSVSVMGLSTAKLDHHVTTSIRPGSIFYDTDGNPINAHGGGFLFYNDTYYWYGEIKVGPTYLPKSNANWGGTRVDLTGISCYSSKDLLNWDYHGSVLPAVQDDVNHDLYPTNVAERPKVVYNAETGKFVLWLHIDSADYQRARCGVAVSNYPEGPFEYIHSFRPNNGQMARDLTVFVDDDAKAYLFTSSEDNAAIHISQLTDDYMSTSGTYKRVFVNRLMEAPTIFKRQGKYYFIGSGCTAWKPNAARSAVASSIWGPWVELGNPCQGKDANTTFHSQSTYILPFNNGDGDEGSHFLFAADRWNEKDLSSSRYVWLPVLFDKLSGSPIIKWRDKWTPANS